MGKAEITSEYILEKVAPYFNKHGYHGTSMSDITAITGLTKGAIYGNFENKEELAVDAFRYNLRKLLNMIAAEIRKCDTSHEQLKAITQFYRNYLILNKELGGCPILKVGMDSVANNQLLKDRVKAATYKMKKSIEDIICEGVSKGELKQDVDAEKMANVFYGIIEGGVLLSTILGEKKPLLDNLDNLDLTIDNITQ